MAPPQHLTVAGACWQALLACVRAAALVACLLIGTAPRFRAASCGSAASRAVAPFDFGWWLVAEGALQAPRAAAHALNALRGLRGGCGLAWLAVDAAAAAVGIALMTQLSTAAPCDTYWAVGLSLLAAQAGAAATSWLLQPALEAAPPPPPNEGDGGTVIEWGMLHRMLRRASLEPPRGGRAESAEQSAPLRLQRVAAMQCAPRGGDVAAAQTVPQSDAARLAAHSRESRFAAPPLLIRARHD